MFNQFAKVQDSKAQDNTLQVYRDENKKIKAEYKKLQEELKQNQKDVTYLKMQLELQKFKNCQISQEYKRQKVLQKRL